ncbi:hypothetical protein [Streptomyces sp. AD55]|uniref:hypothetical protein n=1 Tax=Streptomyces sp. AD55 TaxID=3242895 RepID=UPI0035276647
MRFEYAEPVRPFRWPKGGESFAGWYFCATTGGHIGYESWLERDRLILLDADPQVRGISSQPFWLHWHDGARRRRPAKLSSSSRSALHTFAAWLTTASGIHDSPRSTIRSTPTAAISMPTSG